MPAAGTPGHPIDLDEVRRALLLLLDPDGWHEIRYCPPKDAADPTDRAVSAPVNLTDLDAAVSEVAGIASWNGAGSIYVTLNPADELKGAATDKDVTRRRWILVDVDPVKAQGHQGDSASDQEHDQALEVGRDIAEYLSANDWPNPVAIDSGNGYHLIYRVDLPNDAASKSLVKGVLHALRSRWPAVDTSVFNASRISKLPGTWARKGEHTAERPHRICRILSAPVEPEAVPVELLKALARPAGDGAQAAQERRRPNPSLDDLLWKMTQGGDRRAAWARKAMEGEMLTVALAKDGERNIQLNKSAFLIGQRLHLGLSEAEARAGLMQVATRLGLSDAEAGDTIDRAFIKGKQEPHPGPQLEDRDTPKGASTNGQHKAAANGQANGQAAEGMAALSNEELGILDADSIQPRNVSELWAGRINVGKLNLIVGESGDGKSQTAYRTAAAVTDPDVTMPDGTPALDHGTVLIIAPEDGAADTLVPRLKAAGANTARVKILTAKVKVEGKNGPQVSIMSFQDLAYWRLVINRIGNVKLLIADPIPSCLGRGVNDYRNQEVRLVLEPFVDLLDELGVALLGVTHLGKSPDLKNPSHKILGSVAYAAISRSTHFTVRDPETPGRRILCHEKSTYGPPCGSLAFTIEPFEVVRPDGEIVRTSRVAYELGTVDASASDLMNADRGGGKKRGPAPAKSRKVAEWLFDYLNGHGGSRVLAAIINDAGEAGHVGGQKPDGKWSGVASLYDARARLADLEGDRAGHEVLDYRGPCKPGGRDVVHWTLRPVAQPRTPQEPAEEAPCDVWEMEAVA